MVKVIISKTVEATYYGDYENFPEYRKVHMQIELDEKLPIDSTITIGGEKWTVKEYVLG